MRFAALTAALLCVTPGAVLAGEWEYDASLYGWFPGLTGLIETEHADLEFDVSGSDLVSNLDMAFMGSFEASNGQWSFIGDFVYSDVSKSNISLSGPLFNEADVGMTLAVLSGYAAYRVVDEADVSVDLAAGFRAYDMQVRTGLKSDVIKSRDIDAGDSWVDPIIGARATWKLSDKWSTSVLADIGGFGIGSDFSWHGLATVNYKFNEKWSARMGYRYLEINKPVQDFDAKIGLGGPLIGVTVSF